MELWLHFALRFLYLYIRDEQTQAQSSTDHLLHSKHRRQSMTDQGLREKIFQGVRRLISGPQILLGPPSLIGAHAVKSFFVQAPNLCKIFFFQFFVQN